MTKKKKPRKHKPHKPHVISPESREKMRNGGRKRAEELMALSPEERSIRMREIANLQHIQAATKILDAAPGAAERLVRQSEDLRLAKEEPRVYQSANIAILDRAGVVAGQKIIQEDRRINDGPVVDVDMLIRNATPEELAAIEAGQAAMMAISARIANKPAAGVIEVQAEREVEK